MLGQALKLLVYYSLGVDVHDRLLDVGMMLGIPVNNGFTLYLDTRNYCKPFTGTPTVCCCDAQYSPMR